MADELLTRAMALADAYARRRAFFAAHPFTREKDERDAEKARDAARAELESFLSQCFGSEPPTASPIEDKEKQR